MLAIANTSDVIIGVVAAVPTTIVAVATLITARRNRAVAQETHKVVQENTVLNTADHGAVQAAVQEFAKNQTWMMQRLTEIHEAFTKHLEWAQEEMDHVNAVEHKVDAMQVHVQKLQSYISTAQAADHQETKDDARQ